MQNAKGIQGGKSPQKEKENFATTTYFVIIRKKSSVL